MFSIDTLFTKTFNKYHNDVFRFIYSYTLNYYDTEDIFQQVFLKFYQNIDKFQQDETYIKKWLLCVAGNEAKNYLKSSWKKRHVIEENIENYGKTWEENDLFSMMKMLPKKYRIPLYCYYYEGYTMAEISSILKIKVSTIKSILKRGKEKMKKEMERVE